MSVNRIISITIRRGRSNPQIKNANPLLVPLVTAKVLLVAVEAC